MRSIPCSVVVLILFAVGTAGCADKSTTTTETTLSTPGGTTTVKVEKEVTQSGDNPPEVQR